MKNTLNTSSINNLNGWLRKRYLSPGGLNSLLALVAVFGFATMNAAAADCQYTLKTAYIPQPALLPTGAKNGGDFKQAKPSGNTGTIATYTVTLCELGYAAINIEGSSAHITGVKANPSGSSVAHGVSLGNTLGIQAGDTPGTVTIEATVSFPFCTNTPDIRIIVVVTVIDCNPHRTPGTRVGPPAPGRDPHVPPVVHPLPVPPTRTPTYPGIPKPKVP